jgi:DNA-binding GntR family transcriptional regulator
MSEVTRILSAIEQGDPHAAEQLLPLIYEAIFLFSIAAVDFRAVLELIR